MNTIRQSVAGSLLAVLWLWSAIRLVGLRCAAVTIGLPLCSSACLLGLRFVLMAFGLSA
jgi:hypothetical protein